MMKKIIVAGATLLMALFMAAPSFAIETKVTGFFWLGGTLNLNPGLESDDSNKETVSYREMQLRLNTETKINDNITFFTRFDILDKLLSSQFTNTVATQDDDNIQFDHAWMRIVSPIGLFQVGRKTGVKWGTDFFDDGNAYGTDRAEYIVPINVGEDKFVIGAVAEKALETLETNRDNDKFYLTGTYVNKEWKTGLLVGLYSYNSFIAGNAVDQTILNNVYSTGATLQATPFGAAFPAAAGAYGTAVGAFSGVAGTFFPRVDGQVYYIAPYFSGKVGPLKINAEFGYITGEAKLKADDFLQATSVIDATNAYINTTPAANPAVYTTTNEATARAKLGKLNKDAKAMCYWLEAGLPMGSANVELGYAFMSGDKDGFSGDLESAGLLGQGEDWEKLFILTSDNTGLDTSLGGSGNIVERGTPMNTAGMSLMYVGGSYNVTDSIALGGIFGTAKADEARAGWDDDYGMELDLSLTLKFLGNLEYKAVAAHLFAGDFWKSGVAANDIDDVSVLYHELTLSF